MAAIRSVHPDALMMLPDTCEYFHSYEGAFKDEAEFLSERRFLIHDLYQGLVNREHLMWRYLLENGIEESEPGVVPRPPCQAGPPGSGLLPPLGAPVAARPRRRED